MIAQKSEIKKRIEEQEYRCITKEFPDISIDNIQTRIRHSPGNYVVFLDSESELDWETTDEFDEKKFISDEDKAWYTCLLSNIEFVQHQPVLKYISENDRKSVHIMLGECLCYLFEKCFSEAKLHIGRVENYVNDRRVEISRKWQLQYCYAIFGVVIFIVALCNIFANRIA